MWTTSTACKTDVPRLDGHLGSVGNCGYLFDMMTVVPACCAKSGKFNSFFGFLPSRYTYVSCALITNRQSASNACPRSRPTRLACPHAPHHTTPHNFVHNVLLGCIRAPTVVQPHTPSVSCCSRQTDWSACFRSRISDPLSTGTNTLFGWNVPGTFRHKSRQPEPLGPRAHDLNMLQVMFTSMSTSKTQHVVPHFLCM